MRTVFALSAMLMLAACGGTTPPPAAPSAVAPPLPSAPKSGLDRVMGADARGLVAQFGQAQQDVREEGARKLQFANAACILDAYLYPSSKGKEPVVTYVATRLPDGRDIDRAACVMALTRRR